MILTVLRRWPRRFFFFFFFFFRCALVVYTKGRFMFSFVFVFFIPFSIVITSLGDGEDGLFASRACV